MKPRFTSTIDPNLYSNANKLQIGSTFLYVGFKFTVTRLSKYSIECYGTHGGKQRFTPFEFESHVNRGFITNITNP